MYMHVFSILLFPKLKFIRTRVYWTQDPEYGVFDTQDVVNVYMIQSHTLGLRRRLKSAWRGEVFLCLLFFLEVFTTHILLPVLFWIQSVQSEL